MKRSLLAATLILLLAVPAFAQLRLDVGIDVPKGIGTALRGNAEISQGTVDFFNTYFIPFPEASLHYQFDLGVVKLGLGARAFTLILESVLWPNAFAEVHLGPVVIEAQAGGGIFAMAGLFNKIDTGKLFFPDLSIWYKIGKKQNFRLGLGAMGFYMPELTTEGIGFAYYFGGKAAITF